MPETLTDTSPAAADGKTPRSNAWIALAVCVLLAGGVLGLFSPTLEQGFFNVDDGLFIYAEPHVRSGLSWSNIAWAFTDGPLGEWYPLTMLSHIFDCQLYGLAHPAGHHLTNILLHAATTVGLFLVLWRMTGQRAVPEVAQAMPASGARGGTSERREGRASGRERDNAARVAPAGPNATLWPSAVVAALFAFHPLHVEPVAWLAQRRDVLSGLFFVLTLAAYGEFTRHPRSLARYLLVAMMLTLGLMAKAILVTMPALLLLLDYWPLGRFRWATTAEAGVRPAQSTGRLILEKLPLVAIALADAGVTIGTHGMRPDALTFVERLANVPVSFVAYLGQMFVPIGLSIFYPHPEAGRSLGEVTAATALLAAISAAAVIGIRRFPYFFVGWFWFLGMLMPVSGLIFVGPQARTDRYTYLSQIGLYIALAFGASDLVARRPARRWVCAAVTITILAALYTLSWRQVALWRNNQTLWEHAVACDPRDSTAHYMLGMVLEEENEDEAGARLEYEKAIETEPGEQLIYNFPRAKGHCRLAGFAARNGKVREAIEHYKRAIELDPRPVLEHNNLGILLVQTGDLDAATRHFEESIALEPNGPIGYTELAITQHRQGKNEEAIKNFEKAVELDRNSRVAHMSLAILLVEQGSVERAIPLFRRAIEIDPDDPLPYQQLAKLLRKQGETLEAAKAEDGGRDAAGRRAEKQNTLGEKLARQGKLAAATGQFRAAIAGNPEFALAHSNLADALAAQGYLTEAITEYRRALKLDPSLSAAEEKLHQLSP